MSHSSSVEAAVRDSPVQAAEIDRPPTPNLLVAESLWLWPLVYRDSTPGSTSIQIAMPSSLLRREVNFRAKPCPASAHVACSVPDVIRVPIHVQALSAWTLAWLNIKCVSRRSCRAGGPQSLARPTGSGGGPRPWCVVMAACSPLPLVTFPTLSEHHLCAASPASSTPATAVPSTALFSRA